jgi:ribosomal protein S18 acetylase RimI-like enzyme
VANPFGSGVAVVQDHALEAEADRLGKLAAQAPATHASIQRYSVRPPFRHGSGWEIQAAAGSPTGRVESIGSVRLTPSGKGVYISDLNVAPEHRNHGVAKQLVHAAMQAARSHGYAVAQLEARPSPGAGIAPSSLVAMYQKLGFRTTGLSHRGSPLMERRT